jgi:sec-independent protein translocase protein TatA
MNTLALLPNLAGPDGLIIFLVILLLFGAKKLPELANGLGQAVKEFSKAKDEIEREVTRPPAVPEPRLEAPREIQPQAQAHVVSIDENPEHIATSVPSNTINDENRTTSHHA